MFGGVSDSRYQTICALFLGVSGLFMHIGYDIQSFVVEPVLHSVHNRRPADIGSHDGYYGGLLLRLAVYNGALCITTFFAPSFLTYARPKWLMVFGALLITFYFATFLFLHRILYFIGSVALGLAFSSYYAGYTGYMAEFSTRRTISRNQSAAWSTLSFSIFIGGLVYIFCSSYSVAEGAADLAVSGYRNYSDTEIRVLFGAFATLAFLSAVLHALLPVRRVKSSIADECDGQQPVGLLRQTRTMLSALTHSRILLITPFYIYMGAFLSFWLSIYPTSLAFTKSLSDDALLPAYFAMVSLAGILIMGAFTALVSMRVRNFGLRPLMCINIAVHFLVYFVFVASTPAPSTYTTNDERALLVQPSRWICLGLAVLMGMADNANNTTRTVISSVVVPEYRAQAFAISRFYHAIASVGLFVLSPWMSVYHYAIGMGMLAVVAACCFWKAAGEIRNDEKAAEQSSVMKGYENHVQTTTE